MKSKEKLAVTVPLPASVEPSAIRGGAIASSRIGKLSENTVAALPTPPRGNRIYYFGGDTLQGIVASRGFGVRVTATGAKSFVLNNRVGPREKRYTIGQWPDWSVLRAVRRGRDLRMEIDEGRDPLAVRQAARTRPPKFATVLVADPPWMKLSALRRPVNNAPPSAERSIIILVLLSPFLSWTQGCLDHPHWSQGAETPPEHVP